MLMRGEGAIKYEMKGVGMTRVVLIKNEMNLERIRG